MVLPCSLRWYNGEAWTVPWINESESVDLSILLPKLLDNPPRHTRPFGTFAYVMDDLKDGGKVLELASLIRMVEHEAGGGNTLDHSVIAEALDVLLKKWQWEWPYPLPGGPEEFERRSLWPVLPTFSASFART